MSDAVLHVPEFSDRFVSPPIWVVYGLSDLALGIYMRHLYHSAYCEREYGLPFGEDELIEAVRWDGENRRDVEQTRTLLGEFRKAGLIK